MVVPTGPCPRCGSNAYYDNSTYPNPSQLRCRDCEYVLNYRMGDGEKATQIILWSIAGVLLLVAIIFFTLAAS